jgi:DNA-binding YbaB/EbfC family protein
MVKGLADLKQFKKMQAEIARIQEELASRRIEASSGGGMVTAVMNGHGELVDLRIDPQVVDPQDVEMLRDLILAAVREAKRNAQEMVQQEMGRLIPAGLGSQIPGLFG